MEAVEDIVYISNVLASVSKGSHFKSFTVTLFACIVTNTIILLFLFSLH